MRPPRRPGRSAGAAAGRTDLRLRVAALVGSVLAATATPALAELPPGAYAQDRAQARTVVVVRVDDVRGLEAGAARGACLVTGVVEAVERGTLRAASRLSVEVPCITARFRPRPGPFPGYAQDQLAQAERVRMFLTDGRLVRRGLDIL